jgi:hypothetical protein
VTGPGNVTVPAPKVPGPKNLTVPGPKPPRNVTGAPPAPKGKGPEVPPPKVMYAGYLHHCLAMPTSSLVAACPPTPLIKGSWLDGGTP